MRILEVMHVAALNTYRKPEIDKKVIPSPQAGGFSISRDFVQSSKTRRTADATMTGKIVGIKAKVKMSFSPKLTPSEVKKIKELVVNKTFFHKLGFVNEMSEWEEITVYFGNYSFDAYGFINGKMMPQSFSFEAVEK